MITGIGCCSLGLLFANLFVYCLIVCFVVCYLGFDVLCCAFAGVCLLLAFDCIWCLHDADLVLGLIEGLVVYYWLCLGVSVFLGVFLFWCFCFDLLLWCGMGLWF